MANSSVKQPLVVSFGGGVNSAAMLVGMHERSIVPDLILFAVRAWDADGQGLMFGGAA